jgi:hypothetical protein
MHIRRLLGTSSVLLLLGSSGCAGLSNTAKGSLVGGGLGAGTGALIGSASGNAGKGALIGTAIGTGVGLLAGNQADQDEKREREAELQQTRAQLAEAESRPTQAPLGLTDVQRLAAAGTSDAVIINQIRTTGSSFQLSSTDIEWLKTNGVSDRVILEMQNAQPRTRTVVGPTRTVIREVGPPAVIYAPRPRPVYVYDPYWRPYPPPPPRPGFGVGVVIR